MGARFPLEVVITGVDRLAVPMKRAQERVAKALEPMKRLNNSLAGLHQAAGLGKVSDALGEIRGKLGGVASAARDFGFRMAALGGIAGGALASIVHSFAETGDELTRLSGKLGIGVEALQELQYAASLNEVEAGTLESTLAVLNRTVGQAASGAGPGRAAFRRLGIELRDTAGKIRPLQDLLPEIADKLNDLGDQGRRAALTAGIFGRAGADLSPLLRKGSAGIREAADEARRLGIIMSKEDVHAADEFADSWTRFSRVLVSVRNKIAAQFIPVLSDVIAKLQVWLVDHREEIAAFAQKMARELPRVLRQVRDLVVELGRKLEPVVRIVQALSDRFGAANVAIGAMALLLGGKLLFSIGAVVPSLVNLGIVIATQLIPALTGAGFSMGGLAAATWAVLAPVLAVAAALGSLVYLGYVIHENWSALSTFFVDMWQSVKFGAIDFARDFKYLVESSIAGPAQAVVIAWGRLEFFFTELWNSIRAKFDAIVVYIQGKVAQLVDALPDWVVDLVSGGGPATVPARAAALPASAAQAAAGGRSSAAVSVSFDNLPAGARVRPERNDGVELDLSMGYAFGGAPS